MVQQGKSSIYPTSTDVNNRPDVVLFGRYTVRELQSDAAARGWLFSVAGGAVTTTSTSMATTADEDDWWDDDGSYDDGADDDADGGTDQKVRMSVQCAATAPSSPPGSSSSSTGTGTGNGNGNGNGGGALCAADERSDSTLPLQGTTLGGIDIRLHSEDGGNTFHVDDPASRVHITVQLHDDSGLCIIKGSQGCTASISVQPPDPSFPAVVVEVDSSVATEAGDRVASNGVAYTKTFRASLDNDVIYSGTWTVASIETTNVLGEAKGSSTITFVAGSGGVPASTMLSFNAGRRPVLPTLAPPSPPSTNGGGGGGNGDDDGEKGGSDNGGNIVGGSDGDGDGEDADRSGDGSKVGGKGGVIVGAAAGVLLVAIIIIAAVFCGKRKAHDGGGSTSTVTKQGYGGGGGGGGGGGIPSTLELKAVGGGASSIPSSTEMRRGNVTGNSTGNGTINLHGAPPGTVHVASSNQLFIVPVDNTMSQSVGGLGQPRWPNQTSA